MDIIENVKYFQFNLEMPYKYLTNKILKIIDYSMA